MKILQDELRKKQALLVSLAIAALLLLALLYIGFERQKYIADAGVKSFTARLDNEFIDNELIADAVGVRVYQQRKAGKCGTPTLFTHQNDGSYTINAHQIAIDNHSGAIVASRPSHEALCVYAATGFIADKINQINSGSFYAHRYIVADDGSFFYWFNPADAIPFDFTTSEMARHPRDFFSPPPRYYDRLLMKDNGTKGLSSTNIYEDKITGTPGYSIVSYIYDLTQRDIGDGIIGYLVYDHTVIELRDQLTAGFGETPPRFLNLLIRDKINGQRLCLQGYCHPDNGDRRQVLSDKYEVRYSLSLSKFLIFSPFGFLPLLGFPLVCWLLQRGFVDWFNRQDVKNRTDTLTGCLNRRMLDILRRKDLSGYAVVVADCNGFKQINDTQGHDTGDRALQIVAQRMRHGIRQAVDFVVRSGGDEFIIFLEATTFEQAQWVALRIAGQVEQHKFVQRGDTVKLSISFGAAEVASDLDEAIRQADARMYEMKRQRKGRDADER